MYPKTLKKAILKVDPAATKNSPAVITGSDVSAGSTEIPKRSAEAVTTVN